MRAITREGPKSAAQYRLASRWRPTIRGLALLFLTLVLAACASAPPRPTLTDARFEQAIREGWTETRLVAEFGTPDEVSYVGVRPQKVLSWRYRQSGVWHSLMHFYVDEQGRVTRAHPGPDPRYEPREGRFPWLLF